MIERMLRRCICSSSSRLAMWIEFIELAGPKRIAEVGVYRGEFATAVLKQCKEISRYYMIDPWRHLSEWNKPANKSDAMFQQFFEEAKSKTDFALNRRVILRGTTTEVIDHIPDGELDFAYIDGDHTLRGITIDLMRCYPKVR